LLTATGNLGGVPGRFFVTTPIYYVNDAPHLGTAYSTVNADALARWHRLIGDESWFLTGTDEHGLKMARAAQDQGVTPKEWVDKMSRRYVDSWAALDVSNDDFIRTTEPRHTASVQRFMQAIYDNGYMHKGIYEGWYCVSCEAYYPESDLLAGQLCPVHERPVEWLTEENWFFELSRFEQPLLEWYESHPDAIFPESRRNEALGIIKGGLQDISITRTSIDWGIPVPFDSAHVVYVWYDALINYITAIGYGEDEERFETWWPAAHHLLGKDIIRFHCVWWPAMCLAAGIDPPAHFIVHGWLLVGGEKMSKTKLNQIDPVELASDIGVDPLRYHLVREVTLGADGDFTYEGLIARYNADLANNLGNLLARVAAVVASKCGGIGPAPRPAAPGVRLSEVAAEVVEASRLAWGRFAGHEALEATWRLVRAANGELEAAEPWKLEPGAAVDAVLGDALEALRIVAVLVSPVMPTTAAELWTRIGLPGRPDEPGAAGEGGRLFWGGYPGGLSVTKGEPLFPRRATNS
jgi:methionyl-tRNA synthetase